MRLQQKDAQLKDAGFEIKNKDVELSKLRNQLRAAYTELGTERQKVSLLWTTLRAADRWSGPYA
jgi:hypothetical protein